MPLSFLKYDLLFNVLIIINVLFYFNNITISKHIIKTDGKYERNTSSRFKKNSIRLCFKYFSHCMRATYSKPFRSQSLSNSFGLTLELN